MFGTSECSPTNGTLAGSVGATESSGTPNIMVDGDVHDRAAPRATSTQQTSARPQLWPSSMTPTVRFAGDEQVELSDVASTRRLSTASSSDARTHIRRLSSMSSEANVAFAEQKARLDALEQQLTAQLAALAAAHGIGPRRVSTGDASTAAAGELPMAPCESSTAGAAAANNSSSATAPGGGAAAPSDEYEDDFDDEASVASAASAASATPTASKASAASTVTRTRVGPRSSRGRFPARAHGDDEESDDEASTTSRRSRVVKLKLPSTTELDVLKVTFVKGKSERECNRLLEAMRAYDETIDELFDLEDDEYREEVVRDPEMREADRLVRRWCMAVAKGSSDAAANFMADEEELQTTDRTEYRLGRAMFERMAAACVIEKGADLVAHRKKVQGDTYLKRSMDKDAATKACNTLRSDWALMDAKSRAAVDLIELLIDKIPADIAWSADTSFADHLRHEIIEHEEEHGTAKYTFTKLRTIIARRVGDAQSSGTALALGRQPGGGGGGGGEGGAGKKGKLRPGSLCFNCGTPSPECPGSKDCANVGPCQTKGCACAYGGKCYFLMPKLPPQAECKRAPGGADAGQLSDRVYEKLTKKFPAKSAAMKAKKAEVALTQPEEDGDDVAEEEPNPGRIAFVVRRGTATMATPLSIMDLSDAYGCDVEQSVEAVDQATFAPGTPTHIELETPIWQEGVPPAVIALANDVHAVTTFLSMQHELLEEVASRLPTTRDLERLRATCSRMRAAILPAPRARVRVPLARYPQPMQRWHPRGAGIRHERADAAAVAAPSATTAPCDVATAAVVVPLTQRALSGGIEATAVRRHGDIMLSLGEEVRELQREYRERRQQRAASAAAVGAATKRGLVASALAHLADMHSRMRAPRRAAQPDVDRQPAPGSSADVVSQAAAVEARRVANLDRDERRARRNPDDEDRPERHAMRAAKELISIFSPARVRKVLMTRSGGDAAHGALSPHAAPFAVAPPAFVSPVDAVAKFTQRARQHGMLAGSVDDSDDGRADTDDGRAAACAVPRVPSTVAAAVPPVATSMVLRQMQPTVANGVIEIVALLDTGADTCIQLDRHGHVQPAEYAFKITAGESILGLAASARAARCLHFFAALKGTDLVFELQQNEMSSDAPGACVSILSHNVVHKATKGHMLYEPYMVIDVGSHGSATIFEIDDVYWTTLLLGPSRETVQAAALSSMGGNVMAVRALAGDEAHMNAARYCTDSRGLERLQRRSTAFAVLQSRVPRRC